MTRSQQTVIELRPATAEDERSLLSTMRSAAWLVPNEEMSNHLSPSLKAQLPAAHRAAEAKLAPAGIDDFRRHLAPCLVLTAPSGMGQEDQRNWLVAAAKALEGIPADLLKLGCLQAHRDADHPSKIIPVILKTIDGAWRGRKGDLSKVNRIIAAVEAA